MENQAAEEAREGMKGPVVLEAGGWRWEASEL